MKSLLVKTFVKNYEATDEPRVRTAYGVLVSVVGIILNVLLFGVKLAAGLLIKSIAVIADSFNNLSDAASSVISFVGVKMAEKPADKEHPFGHGRMEYIAAFIVAFLVIEVGFSFFKSSIEKIISPEAIEFSLISVIILAISIGIKAWIGFFNSRIGKAVDSKVMRATAADSFSDVVITSVTVISILVTRFFEINIDGYVGLLLSLIVIWNGINIAKDTLAPLIGESMDKELCEKIRTKVESYDGIVGTHDLIVHNYGPGRSMATIHAEVSADINPMVSHAIIDKIEENILSEMNVFLVIHMDPVEVDNEVVNRYKELVKDIVHKIDDELDVHDFRIVEIMEGVNLIFDLVLPYKYKAEEESRLKNVIISKIRETDPNCNCIIKIERGYM
ncbi:MAG: cation transporter [Lachnospiraceae bacterium]|nr:cation transporter [Lachnospiraceae bacterium]